MDYSLYHGSLTLALSNNGRIFREGRQPIQDLPTEMCCQPKKGRAQPFICQNLPDNCLKMKYNKQRESLPLRTLNQMDSENVDISLWPEEITESPYLPFLDRPLILLPGVNELLRKQWFTYRFFKSFTYFHK